MSSSSFFSGDDAATYTAPNEGGCQKSDSAVCQTAPQSDPRHLARATDPLTSHQAAARVGEFAQDHQARVLAALNRAGGRAGAEQIGWLASMEPYAVRKRTVELERQGLIRRTGATCMTRSGRREQEWAVVTDPCFFSSDEAHG